MKALSILFTLLVCLATVGLTTVCFTSVVQAQVKTARLTGKVIDQDDQPVAKVTIAILGKQTATASNDSGYFELTVPANRAFALVFTHTGFKTLQRNFILN